MPKRVAGRKHSLRKAKSFWGKVSRKGSLEYYSKEFGIL